MKTLKKVQALVVGSAFLASVAVAQEQNATQEQAKMDLVSFVHEVAKNLDKARIVVGDAAPAVEVAAAADVVAALVYDAVKQATETEKVTYQVKNKKVVIEYPKEMQENIVPLYKENTKLYLFDHLNKAVTTIYDKLVFGTGTFEDKDGNKYTYVTDLSVGNATIYYLDKPDTDVHDPTLLINASYPTAPVYTLEVQFTSPLNSTAVQAKEIDLFGKKFYFKSVSDGQWVLYEAAKDVLMRTGETVDFEGKKVTLVGLATNGTSITGAVLNVSGTIEKVDLGQTEEINGIKVTVIDAYYVDNVGYARVLLGGNEVTFTKGSPVQVGDTQIENTYVEEANPSELRIKVYFSNDNTKNYLENGKEFVDPVFGTFKVVFPKVDLKANKYELRVVDTGDKTADLVVTDFRGYTKTLSNFIYVDSNNNTQILDNKYEGQINGGIGLGNTSLSYTITVPDNKTNYKVFYVYGEDGQVHTINVTARDTDNAAKVTKVTITIHDVTANKDLNSTSKTQNGSYTLTATVGNVELTVSGSVSGIGTPQATVTIGANTTDNVLYNENITDKVISRVDADRYLAITVSPTERYLFRVKTIDTTNKEVTFEDVFTGDDYTVTYDSKGFGDLIVGGKRYYFHVYKDTTTNTYELFFFGREYGNNEIRLALKGDSVLDARALNSNNGHNVTFDLYDNVNGQLVKIFEYVIDYNTNDGKLEIQSSNVKGYYNSGTLNVTAQPASNDNDYKLLDRYGDYAEFKASEDYYFRLYYPDEQVSYKVYLAPVNENQSVEYETMTVTPGQKIDDTNYVVKDVQADVEVTPEQVTMVDFNKVPKAMGLVVTDTEVVVDNGKLVYPGAEYFIVMGTKADNSVVAQMCNESVAPGSAVVKLAENGKVAFVVGGTPKDVADAAEVVAKVAMGVEDVVNEVKGKTKVTVANGMIVQGQ